ncbi:Long-chain-fatty-acid--[acyl-carrier-protein] ligase AEE15, chloroplastic [Vitis vinifera]|uniref:Long-chain-fatty-acid--[acyl-carrier-protein] ligase AEE15, chloroplastic n=1 Tax=Vitis vinifera TaxID=29760 RepID=A0A438C931_VITVI|nr:Long-chain-fatty-acid--[acyl-carrier-protein] ligase AEE15, chloroplastic [Vitis vinifera]
MLPSWHAYERASEYFIFTHGIEQVYTTVPNLKEDLRRYQPQYLISVPLVYETLYRVHYFCLISVVNSFMVYEYMIKHSKAILVVPTVSFSVHCFKFLFIFCSSGIQKQISTSSTVRKLVALTFIRISLAYMELKRIYEV